VSAAEPGFAVAIVVAATVAAAVAVEGAVSEVDVAAAVVVAAVAVVAGYRLIVPQTAARAVVGCRILTEGCCVDCNPLIDFGP